MIRRPPRSTLFPYPPLSQSSRTLNTQGFSLLNLNYGPFAAVTLNIPIFNGGIYRRQEQIAGINIKNAQLTRSEEHTSELQSQSNLVCRLLLEKKKKQIHQRQQNQPSYLVRSQRLESQR